MTLSREMTFALELAEQAGTLALKYFREGITYEMKSDNTPVTVADREVEDLIARAVKKEFPHDEILAEESCLGGEAEAKSVGRRWIVDPIDGTYNFARGIPIFCTLIALEEDGVVKLGLVHAPAFKDTFLAEKGQGAFHNGKRLQVSSIDNLGEAQFNFGAPKRILARGLWNGFTQLVSSTYRQRGFGDYLSFALFFEGKAELALDVGLKPWDLAPMKIICEEAGGEFHDLAGGNSIYTGDCLLTNGHLSEPGLKVLLGG